MFKRGQGLAVVAILLAASTGCSSYLAASPRIYVDTGRDPFATLPPEQRTTDLPLLYATDRKPAPAEARLTPGFSRASTL